MSSSNPQGSSDAGLSRVRTRLGNNVASPFASFDDILVDTPDRLVYEDPDITEKRLKMDRSKRVAFKRAVLKVIAKIRKDKGKRKAKGN